MASLLGLTTESADIAALAVLPQRSPAWHAARLTRITASDAAAFASASPHITYADALQKKLDADAGKAQQIVADAARRMQVGHELEAVAAASFLKQLRDNCGHQLHVELQEVGIVVLAPKLPRLSLVVLWWPCMRPL